MTQAFRANEYRRNALATSTGLHLVIALYDGAMRFLREAAHAAEMDDAVKVRDNAQRAIAILVHLQARLKQEEGAEVCAALSEFYAATLALVLEGARQCSSSRLYNAESCLQNVRSAWSEAARGIDLSALPPQSYSAAGVQSSWSA